MVTLKQADLLNKQVLTASSRNAGGQGHRSGKF
jgi:hypothetical protein